MMAQRRKDKQKNKAKMKKRRMEDFTSQVQHMDPEYIQKELKFFELQDKKGELTFRQKHRWEQLKTGVEKFKSEIEENTNKRRKKKEDEAEERRLYEMRLHAKDSIYYDAQMNPLGAPPPGQPVLYKHPDGSIKPEPPGGGSDADFVNPFLPKKQNAESSDDSDDSDVDQDSQEDDAATGSQSAARGFAVGPSAPALPKSRPPGAPALPKGPRPGAAPLPKGPPPKPGGRPPGPPPKKSAPAPPPKFPGVKPRTSTQFQAPPGPPPKSSGSFLPPPSSKQSYVPSERAPAPPPVSKAPAATTQAPAKPTLFAPVSVRVKHKPQPQKVSSRHVSSVGQVTAFSTSASALKQDTVVSEKPFEKHAGSDIDEAFADFMDSINDE
jgi:hypothetical protein